MKRVILFFLWICLPLSSFSQEAGTGGVRRKPARRGEAVGYTTRDATVLSMMGWGVGIAVGIATFFALMDNNATSGGGGGGSNGHSH